jgi:beta-mannanase
MRIKRNRQTVLIGAALYAALILALYRYGVSAVERGIGRLWYEQVVAALAKDRNSLTERDHGIFGLYRPELPFHFDQLYAMQDSLNVRVDAVSYYQAWGDGEEHAFKTDVMNNLHRGGFIPFVTWEPWAAAFEAYEGRMPDSSLALITSGIFDEYIREWAREATRFGHPFFVRPLHEMTNPTYPWSSAYKNSPEMFVSAWKHIVMIFRDSGARNASFVWTPYRASDTAYYPGNEWVDWIGLDIFNYGPLEEQALWLDFFTITRTFYDAVKGYEKPIIVAEVGTVPMGGNKNMWYRDMFHSLAAGNFPLIEGLVIFDNPASSAPNGLNVDLSMSSDPEVYSVIDEDILRQADFAPPEP